MSSSEEKSTIPEQFAVDNLAGASDYYELLGVATDASAEEITDIYRQRAPEVHPDQSDASDAERQFSQLVEAKSVLTDENRRWLYDHLGHEGYYRLTTQNDADLKVQIEIVQEKIAKKDDYTPPIETMGEESETKSREAVPKPKTVALERAVTETLEDLPTNGEAEEDDLSGTFAWMPSSTSQSSTTEESNQQQTNEAASAETTTESDSTPQTETVREGHSEEQSDTEIAAENIPDVEESEQEKEDELRLREYAPLVVGTTRNRITDPDVRHTAHTVTTMAADEAASITPVWNYWQRPDIDTDASNWSPATLLSLVWLGRFLVVGLFGVGAISLALTAPFTYGGGFVVAGLVGAGSAVWLTSRTTPGASSVDDPGLWRWPQSIGRLLILFGATQVVFATVPPTVAASPALAGTLSTGVWDPPAATSAITQIFVLLTVMSLLLGTVLVAVGLSWRLWVDRLAGGYVSTPLVFESIVTGTVAVVGTTALQTVAGDPAIGVLPFAFPAAVTSRLPGLATLHIGFVAALGISVLPTVYALWVRRAPRIAPLEATDSEASDGAPSDGRRSTEE